MQALTYVEIDVPYCSLAYGSSPCTASIPGTGSKKCFNTKFTCQDRSNFADAPVTLRFSQAGRSFAPMTIEAIPAVVGIQHNPGAISLGKDLGERASVTITLKDFRHNDTGAGGDKYITDRAYDAYSTGTYFGRFRTRHRYLKGNALRVIRGTTDDASTATMTTRHYIIESFSGPDANGGFTIVAKDPLKQFDDDRVKVPAVSSGFLASDITSGAVSATLSPAGIGNAEYEASGYLAIAGKEVVAFTRVADVLTITRAQFNTTAIAHKAQDRVQTVKRYVSQDVADIINDIATNFAGVDASYIPLSSWQTETAAYIGTLYTATIVEPTGAKTLINELIEQAALVMWWDEVAQLIRLQVLRAIASTADTFDEQNTLEGSLSVSEQPDKRLTQVWVYFNLRNPCEKLEDDNFQSVAAVVDLERETDYGSAAIKKILSRWIPNGGRSVALRLGDTQLARFKDPPRLFEFSLFRGASEALLGGGYKVGSWALQDDEGAPELAAVQVTRLAVDDATQQITAEEILFDYTDSGGGGTGDDRVIILDISQNNVNLQTLHDSLFPPVVTVGAITLTVVIDVGVVIGSASTGTPAFDVGTFPIGLPITVQVKGRIQGAGGQGGGPANPQPSNGSPGGTALYTRQAITLDLATGSGEVWGGGGGGRGSTIVIGSGNGGGGGAGTVPGAGGTPVGAGVSNTGTATAGGASAGTGGTGGGPGLVGGGPGGAAGNQIDGVSYVTVSGTGDRRGPTIN